MLKKNKWCKERSRCRNLGVVSATVTVRVVRWLQFNCHLLTIAVSVGLTLPRWVGVSLEKTLTCLVPMGPAFVMMLGGLEGEIN